MRVNLHRYNSGRGRVWFFDSQKDSRILSNAIFTLALLSGSETAYSEFGTFCQVGKIFSTMGLQFGKQKSVPSEKKVVWGSLRVACGKGQGWKHMKNSFSFWSKIWSWKWHSGTVGRVAACEIPQGSLAYSHLSKSLVGGLSTVSCL